MTSGFGRELSPHTYRGQFVEELPEFIKSSFLRGVKNPRVTVQAKSSKQGEGILGFVIKDGNKTVNTSAFALDSNGSYPIFHVRSNWGNGSQKTVSINTLLDTNLSGQNAFRGDVFVNSKLAKELGVSDTPIAFAEGISNLSKKSSEKALNEQIKWFKAFWNNKGKEFVSVEELGKDFAKIATQTGKVTEKSATDAVNVILRKMGYNPKDVKLTFLPKNAQEGGHFAFVNPELALNLNMLTSHQDLALILSHELTHMEDAIMLYKQLGAEKFQKLLNVPKIDKKWYDKMSKLIINKNSAFEHKEKVVEIIKCDGTKITDPKLIEEFEKNQQALGKKFDINAMKREFKEDAILEKANGEYFVVKRVVSYINSPMEEHARRTAQRVLHEIEGNGRLRKTKFVDKQGAPGEYSDEISNIFKQIENALKKSGKYGMKKNAEFNRLYSQTEQAIYPEYAELKALIEEKLKQQAPSKEINKLIDKGNKMLETRYKSAERYNLEILEVMQAKLGLRPFPESRDLHLQALNAVDSELGKIQAQLYQGVSTKEWKSLLKREKDIIKERYQTRLILSDKVYAKKQELLRKIIEEV